MILQCASTIFIVRGFCILLAANHGQSEQEQARQALELMAKGGSSLYEGRDLLERIAPTIAIPAIVNSLRNGESFQADAIRYRAYEILLHHRSAMLAAEVPGGFNQLLAGLEEPCCRHLCARALGNTQPEFAGLVVSTLRERTRTLVDSRRILSEEQKIAQTEADSAFLSAVLGTFARQTTAAVEAVPEILEVVLDPEWTINVRSVGCYALLNCDDLMEVSQIFASLDAPGKLAAARALGKFAAERGGLVGAPRVAGTMLRQFVLESLYADNTELRASGLEALIPVFGEDLVARGGAASKLNPVVEEALVRMAENDSDKVLRERARAGLESMRTRVAKLSEGKSGK